MVLASVPVGPAIAKEQTAEFSGNVAAGERYGARLRNLPKGTSLAIDLTTSEKVVLWLLDRDNYRRFPNVERSLMRASTAGRLDFSILIPEAGNYFLVVDNRSGERNAEFTVRVHAALDAGGGPLVSRVQDELGKLEDGLRKLMIFDPLGIEVENCSGASLGSADDVNRLCAGSVRRLLAEFDDDDTAKAALQFAVLHRIGHILLRQWGFPFHGNEEIADEMATVLMVMFGAGDAAREQARHFVAADAEPSERADEAGSRHRLTERRARAVLRSLDNPEFARGWQAVLVPRMQTDILERLRAQSQPWSDDALVERELASRRNSD